MKTLNHMQVLMSVLAALMLGTGFAAAQNRQGNQTPQQNQQRNAQQNQLNMRNMNFRNMDPQQIQQMIQQRMMEMLRERLVVTNDAEWRVIEQRLSKVMRLRMETAADGAGMMGMGGMAFGRGGFGGRGRGPRGLQAILGEPSPEARALQQAIENNVPTEQLKGALARFREARQRKQQEVTKAQEQLRQVLTIRQEAILVSMSILD